MLCRSATCKIDSFDSSLEKELPRKVFLYFDDVAQYSFFFACPKMMNVEKVCINFVYQENLKTQQFAFVENTDEAKIFVARIDYVCKAPIRCCRNFAATCFHA